MRRQARAAGGGQTSQLLAGSDNVDRGRVLGLSAAMGDGKGEPTHVVGARVITKFVAEKPEKRDDPGIAGQRGGKIRFGEPLQPMAKHPPQSAGICEGGRDLIGEASTAIEPEVGRTLTGQIGGEKLIQDVGSEQSPFDANGGEQTHGCTRGCKIRSPRRSGGSWGITESSRIRRRTACQMRLRLCSRS